MSYDFKRAEYLAVKRNQMTDREKRKNDFELALRKEQDFKTNLLNFLDAILSKVRPEIFSAGVDKLNELEREKEEEVRSIIYSRDKGISGRERSDAISFLMYLENNKSDGRDILDLIVSSVKKQNKIPSDETLFPSLEAMLYSAPVEVVSPELIEQPVSAVKSPLVSPPTAGKDNAPTPSNLASGGASHAGSSSVLDGQPASAGRESIFSKLNKGD